MTNEELQVSIKQRLASVYPDIEVRVCQSADDETKREITFIEEKFRVLYPRQRYHYLIHALPEDFYREHLANAIWIELAPGENADDLDYHDDEVTSTIREPIMKCILASRFFEKLDDKMSPLMPWKNAEACHGDFRIAKNALAQSGFHENEYSDVLHVLMAQGAYCDCEILYNVAPQSRLKTKCWKKRGGENDNPTYH